MKKSIAFVLILTVSCVLLYGCGKNEKDTSQSFDSASISHIIINAGDHPVVLEDTQEKEIVLSLSEGVKEIGKVEEQTLKIQLLPPSGIINIKEPSKLVVGIPSEWNGSVDVISEAGTAQAENISLLQLTVESDSGNILLKSVSGTISAKTKSGKIKADNIAMSQLTIESDSGEILLNKLSGTVLAKTDTGRIQVPDNIADQVKPGNMNLGEVFEAQIGNIENSDNKISVYTNAGNIKIN